VAPDSRRLRSGQVADRDVGDRLNRFYALGGLSDDRPLGADISVWGSGIWLSLRDGTVALDYCLLFCDYRLVILVDERRLEYGELMVPPGRLSRS